MGICRRPVAAHHRTPTLKPAVWVTCENTHTLAQLTVWTSGEADLVVGDVSTGATTSTHYDLTTRQDLNHCLDDLTGHLHAPQGH